MTEALMILGIAILAPVAIMILMAFLFYVALVAAEAGELWKELREDKRRKK